MEVVIYYLIFNILILMIKMIMLMVVRMPHRFEA